MINTGENRLVLHQLTRGQLGKAVVADGSRGIIAAYKQEKYQSFGPENFGDASRAAVKDMAEDIKGALENRA